jgi:hypothetical protein
MDPTVIIQTLVISSALATCPATKSEKVAEAMRAPAAPVVEWPEPQERPEKGEPPHGEGSGESPIYGGLAVYGGPAVNVSNVSARLIVDSGASGFSPYASVAWLPNSFPLVVSIEDFEADFIAASARPSSIQVDSYASTQPYNPSATKIRQAYTRRRG